jgi:hypothetical protein
MHWGAEPEALGGHLVVRLVPWRDDDPYLADFGHCLVGGYGLAQDGLAVQQRILLGKRPPKTTSSASGNDKGGADRHSR